MNTEVIVTKRNQIFINNLCFSFTSFYFIEEEGCFGETMRLCNFRVLCYPTNEKRSFFVSWNYRWLLECHDACEDLTESEVFRLFPFCRSVRVILTLFHDHVVNRLARFYCGMVQGIRELFLDFLNAFSSGDRLRSWMRLISVRTLRNL